MNSFSDDELEQMGVILPNYSRSLCIKAFALARDSLGEATKDEFIELMFACLELLKIDLTPSKAEVVNSLASSISPMSQLFKEPDKINELTQLADEVIPQNNPILSLYANGSSDNSPKVFFAAAIFSLIIIMSLTEKKLKQDAVSSDQLISKLDAWSEQLQTMYTQLLYFDSELEVIKNNAARHKGTVKKNEKFSQIHYSYFDYYEKNRIKWPSNDECARQFYRSLPEDKKVYQSMEHARRQLTTAHRKFKKSTTST